MTRLIDADGLIKTLNEKNIPVDVRVNYEIMNAPTIEPDGDTISRQALMKRISEEYHEYGDDYDALQILGDIEDFPSAPDSRQRGEWIFEPKDAIELMFTLPKCSECGFESSDGGNFCSNCGARMYKGGDSE